MSKKAKDSCGQALSEDRSTLILKWRSVGKTNEKRRALEICGPFTLQSILESNFSLPLKTFSASKCSMPKC